MNEADDNLFAVRERRAKRETAQRIKHFVGVLTNGSYAVLAGGSWQPLLDGKPFQLIHALALGFGPAGLVVAVYLAPRGEFADDGR